MKDLKKYKEAIYNISNISKYKKEAMHNLPDILKTDSK